jgi:hypothetical protein
MRHRTVIVSATVIAVLTAGFLALVYIEDRREPSKEALNRAQSRASVGVEAPTGDRNNGQSSGSGDTARLREMSQSFRNSTFLITVRDAGFYCDDVVAAHESGDGIWIARCTDAREYKIAAPPTDKLSVEPIYFDAPIRGERLQLDRDPLPEGLEPERLRQ